MTNCMKLVGKFNNLFTWGLKEVTFKINDGLLLSSLILDYMIIRVKEKKSGEGKIKRTERGRTSEKWEKRRGKQRH